MTFDGKGYSHCIFLLIFPKVSVQVWYDTSVLLTHLITQLDAFAHLVIPSGNSNNGLGLKGLFLSLNRLARSLSPGNVYHYEILYHWSYR